MFYNKCILCLIYSILKNEKNNFLDRKEFKGSILEIYDTIIDYLKNNTATYGLINTSVREDIEEYP